MEISTAKPPANFSDTARARRSADAAESSRTAENAAVDRKADARAERAPPKEPSPADSPRGRQVDFEA